MEENRRVKWGALAAAHAGEQLEHILTGEGRGPEATHLGPLATRERCLGRYPGVYYGTALTGITGPAGGGAGL